MAVETDDAQAVIRQEGALVDLEGLQPFQVDGNQFDAVVVDVRTLAQVQVFDGFVVHYQIGNTRFRDLVMEKDMFICKVLRYIDGLVQLKLH